MAALSAIAAGAGAVGGISGLISGLTGTPEQEITRKLSAMTPEEQKAIQDSLQAYAQGQAGIGQQEADILGRQGLQDQSRDVLGQALGGGLYQATPQELAQLDVIRQSQIGTGQTEIQRLLQAGLGQTEAGAAARGVRGQALSELQGQQGMIASQRLQDVINQANQGYAQGAMNAPMQRAQSQIGIAGAGSSFADQLRQQALQNRLQFQTPGALANMSAERMGNYTQTTPGQGGGFGDAFSGLMGGFGAGAKGASDISNAFGSFGNRQFGSEAPKVGQ